MRETLPPNTLLASFRVFASRTINLIYFLNVVPAFLYVNVTPGCFFVRAILHIMAVQIRVEVSRYFGKIFVNFPNEISLILVFEAFKRVRDSRMARVDWKWAMKWIVLSSERQRDLF